MSGCDIITLSSEDESDSSNQDVHRAVKINTEPAIVVKSYSSTINTLENISAATDKNETPGISAYKIETSKVIPEDVKMEHNCGTKNNLNESSGKKNGEHREEQDIFQKFVNTCFKYDNSKSMHIIINNKLRRYFNSSNPMYVSSKQFIELLNKQIGNIINDPKNIFVPIKEVADELRSRRLKEPPSKRQKLLSGEANVAQELGGTGSNSEGEIRSKASDQLVRKLCKTLRILHRRIKKIEEKDVDWEEDNDSSYIQLQRFKERFCKIHQKLQEYEGECGDGSKKFRKRISFTGTPFPTVNRTIEKFVNKKGEFPDYFDVLKLLKTTYETENIKIKPEMLHIHAKAAFQDIGGQLQKQRQYDYWDSHCMYLEDKQDPAELDNSLQVKLQENQEKYGYRITEVINKFALQESLHNLQPVEVAEEDADKSEEETNPKDDDDEEEDDEDDEDDEDEDEKGFLDKVLKGEDDLKDNFSSDGDDDDDVTSLDYRYCGPVSPPTLQYDDEDVMSFTVEGCRTSPVSDNSRERAALKDEKKIIYKPGIVPQSSTPVASDFNETLVKHLEETVSKQDTLPFNTSLVSSAISETMDIQNDKQDILPATSMPKQMYTCETNPVSVKEDEKLINTIISVQDSSGTSDTLPFESRDSNNKLVEKEYQEEDGIVMSGKVNTKQTSTNQILSNDNMESQHIDGKLASSEVSQNETHIACNVKQEFDAPKKITNCLRVKSFGSIANMDLNIWNKSFVSHKSKDISGAKGSEEDDIILID